MESSFLFPVELLQTVIRENIVSRCWTRSVGWINYSGFNELFGEKLVLSPYHSFFVCLFFAFCCCCCCFFNALEPNPVFGDEKEIILPPQVPEKQFTHPLGLVHYEETA